MSIISLFPKAADITASKQITLASFLENIKEGVWKEPVEKVRLIKDKKQRDELKKGILPGVTISGTFDERAAKNLLNHSGFISIDIDTKIENRDQLEKDPYTYALFDSASKGGLCIIVKIKKDKHAESFCFLEKYYFQTYNIVIDSAPKNVASLRFVSYDPNIKINHFSKVSGTYKIKREIKIPPVVLSSGEIDELIRLILESGKDIAPAYEQYLGLAFAIASEFRESGMDIFHSICKLSPKYDAENASALYHAACKKENDPTAQVERKRTIAYLYVLAERAGVPVPPSDRFPVIYAALLKKEGKTKDQIAEHLVTQKTISPEQSTRVAIAVTQNNDITLKTLSSDPEHLIETLILYIQNRFPLKRNAITQKIEHAANKTPITEEDLNDIYLQSRAAFNSPNVTKDLINCIIFSNQTFTYNPFTDFIKNHLSVNSTGHITSLIASINTTTPNADKMIRKWLISLHAAIEGNPVRIMLTFTGPQYNGKTEFFRRLLPPDLKSYYAESKLDRGKDDELLMCQKLIVMDDEMGGKSKQDEKRLKELTSKEYFSLRAPYRRDNMDYKRLAVLCGTSNPTEIMNDPTGNTRILPVKVDSIDFNLLNSIDRTALFMEAYHAYQSGESWQLEQQDVEVLQLLSDDFSAISFERELILHHFQRVPHITPSTDWLTATQIKDEIEKSTKQQIKNMTRFGIELRKIFGDPKSVKRHGMPSKCYPVLRTVQNVVTTDFSEPTESEELPF